jgi:hypothetical protein
MSSDWHEIAKAISVSNACLNFLNKRGYKIYKNFDLFNGDGLSKVTGLIDVMAKTVGNVIR